MNFTGESIKKATTTVGMYVIEYNITFDSENNPLKASARVSKSNMLIAQSTYKAIRSQVTIGFSDAAMTTPEERVQLYTAIENDLANIFNPKKEAHEPD